MHQQGSEPISIRAVDSNLSATATRELSDEVPMRSINWEAVSGLMLLFIIWNSAVGEIRTPISCESSV